jgi:hypothetical protein
MPLFPVGLEPNFEEQMILIMFGTLSAVVFFDFAAI